MTRIIVKNLPKHITQERFKQHFEAKGTVTDAKLIYTKDGVFRRFGFIGYKSQKEAEIAKNYFNKSFIDTSRIEVDFARGIGAEDIPRAWSKYSKGTSAYYQTAQGKKELEDKKQREEASKHETVHVAVETVASKLKKAETDEKLKEFIKVMQPRSQSKTWGNDETESAKIPSVSEPLKTIDDGNASDEEYQDLVKVNQQVQEKPDQDKEITDCEYFKSKIMNIECDDIMSEDEDKNDISVDPKMNPERMAALGLTPPPDNKENYQRPSHSIANQDSINVPSILNVEEKESRDPIQLLSETGRIFMRNLPYTATSSDLTPLFSQYGPLSELHISIDKLTKQSKGYGFVLFLLPEHAVKAFNALNGSIFQGRILDLAPAKEKLSEDIEPRDNTYKAKKEVEKKKSAHSEFTWNSLFMNSDSVVDAMAHKLGVKKSEILNPEEENMAVRVSLAETEIIQDTKTHLEKCGIQLVPSKERSKTIIIVKNIPYNTTELEIRDLFDKFGTLGRLIFPPTKTLAIVEFLAENEAKIAFKRLAYTRFKNLPLYLEYAPANTFVSPYSEEETSKIRALTTTTNTSINQVPKRVLEVEEEAEETHSLFIKNLSFSTTLTSLHDHFSAFPGFKTARVATKPDPKNPGGRLSMGYGFIEFDGKENAKGCMNEMQGKVIEGHAIEIKFSHNGAGKKKVEEEGSRKIIVRNIAFEATKKDIMQLFSPYGQIKSVRLPKKMGGHRGFAFVQFLTKQEAKNAFEALFNTHLYGRHLVLEWAKDDDTVDTLREKTKRGFVKVGNKRSKVELEDEMDFEDEE